MVNPTPPSLWHFAAAIGGAFPSLPWREFRRIPNGCQALTPQGTTIAYNHKTGAWAMVVDGTETQASIDELIRLFGDRYELAADS